MDGLVGEIQTSDILLSYKKANLDFFGSDTKQDQTFEVDSVAELKEIWKVCTDLLDSEVLSIQNELIETGRKEIKNLFSRKQLDTFYSEKKQHSEISDFEHQLYLLDNSELVCEFIKSFFQNTHQQDISLLDLASFLDRDSLTHFLPVEVQKNQYIYLCWEECNLNVLGLYCSLSEYFKNYILRDQSQVKNERWADIINLIQVPLVLLEKKGQPLIINKAFSHLNFSIKECLALNHNEQITLGDNVYRVLISESEAGPDETAALLFFPVNDILTNKDNLENSAIGQQSAHIRPSSEELGIVSSSIAHELNNPLAGILAAIEVLGLDDLPEDFQESLDEMKKGVLRCKKLVETFLGFSRLDTSSEFHSMQREFNFHDSLQQALELIRFRLIENNMTVNLKFNVKTEFYTSQNPHIISMFFYLILGEVLTSFSHYNLVKGERGVGIDLKCNEYGHKITLEFPIGVTLKESFLKSKLIVHLSEVESLKVTIVQNQLELKRV